MFIINIFNWIFLKHDAKIFFVLKSLKNNTHINGYFILITGSLVKYLFFTYFNSRIIKLRNFSNNGHYLSFTKLNILHFKLN